jgi:hypothetical protein
MGHANYAPGAIVKDTEQVIFVLKIVFFISLKKSITQVSR